MIWACPCIGHADAKLPCETAKQASRGGSITWSIVSGFKGLENDVVILAALTNIETDWHQGVAYVGMSRARTRLHVIIHEDCNGKRRAREREWGARGEGDLEMLL